MFKKTMVAAGIIASSVAFTQGALAAAATVTQTATATTFAHEIFGTGSSAVVLTSTGGSQVVLTVGGAVDAGEAADFTFTLTGATFGQAVALTDLAYTGAGGVTVTKTAGGNAGNGSVTFNVVVTGALAAAETITLDFAALTGAGAALSSVDGAGAPNGIVTAVTGIVQVSTSGVNTFPTTITGSGTAGAIVAADSTIANAADEVDADHTAAGTNAQIDVDSRADLTVATTTAIDHDDDLLTATLPGVDLGTIDYVLAGVGVGSDGAAYSNAATKDGAGTLDVSVTGNFNAGDVIFVDLFGGTANTVDTGEALTVAGGVASGSFSLATWPGASQVFYVANGVDTLTPTTYTLGTASNYSSGTGLAETDSTSTSTTYTGLTQQGWTLAVPGSASPDKSNIRVTNETNVANAIFAQCYAQDGTDLGFEEIGSIAANATEVYNATELEAVFGTWSGRMRCDFSTSGNISVQTMIRDASGILNNMTGSSGTATNAAGGDITR